MKFNVNNIRPETRARLLKFVAEEGFKNLETAIIFIWRNDSRINTNKADSHVGR